MITLYAAEEPDCAFFVDVAQSQVMDRWDYQCWVQLGM